MNFLFIHSWKGFSLAEWYLKNTVPENFSGTVKFQSLDLPVSEIPANDFLPKAIFYHQPDLIGFSCYYWNIEYFIQASQWIKKIRPDVKIVLGGPQVKSLKTASDILQGNESIDFIIRGEGEMALCHLMEELEIKRSGAYDNIPNLSYREAGTIRHNNETRPYLSRKLIFYNANKELTEQISKMDEVSYETVRGCYEKCAFCFYPTAAYGLVDDELIFAELSFLCTQPIKNLRICDTHFGGNRERAKRIFRHLASHNRGINIRIYPDMHHVDQEYIDLLKASGSKITSISIQTTNLKVLRRINRKPVHQLKDKIELVLNAFPDVPADLIIGLPGDNIEGLKQTFNDILDLGFSRVNLFRLMLFPGTEMYEHRSRFFDEEHLILSSTGQVITSSDFPPEVQPQLSHLLFEMETRCFSAT